MPAHLLNLLTRAFMAIPSSLGSNWLGLVFPVLAVLMGEGIAWWVWGLAVVKANWTKATGIGFAALGIMYTLLFMWCIVTTTYGDHVGLANRVGILRGVINRDAVEKLAAVGEFRQELTDVKQECAEIKGERRALDNQTKVQQATINNCQTQALKLLTPESQKITVLPFDFETTEQERRASFLLITNKTVSPVRLDGFCDIHLESITASPVGIGSYSGGAQILYPSMPSLRYAQPQQPTSFQITFGDPAWSPESPIRVKLIYHGLKDATCTFNVK